ncbi:sensor histidine kinase [Streptomyces sp. GC420]|nr:histidine kinase [Streptomyces sp. GC420]NBM14161.1 sensor histidine kinase [Streptomyces sp. GC420]
MPRGRTILDTLMWSGAVVLTAASAQRTGVFRGWVTVLLPLGLLCCAAAVLGYHRVTVRHRLLPALGLLAVPVLLGAAAFAAGARAPAVIVCTVCSVLALERLPLAAGLAFDAMVLGAHALVADTGAGKTAGTILTVLLVGYSLRLDAQARGAGFRLLAQERAARAAEAESAALAERARIAREIHDVLAHSLSAQLVHLEAARIQIERGADRGQILQRVVSARAMAREGLAETRQALSALRGELTSVEAFLRELAEPGAVVVEVAGEPRPLPAEPSQAVRRVAQEALTNVRKHAPGARVRILLRYEPGEVALDVRDSGGTDVPGELGSSGSGYGLLGMRERAELLGGTLEAGPVEEGFAVRLRVPA